MNDITIKAEPNSDVEQDEEPTLTLEDTAVISGRSSVFTCSECGQSFKTKSSLHYHQRKYRHCGMEPFACELCGKEFGIATHLTSHTRTHTKQRPFFCPLEDCDRVYSRIDLVNVHLIKCHKINYKVKSKCFQDGVFSGQVFINGEMRLIQKNIPDKGGGDAAAADGETPHGLAAKIQETSWATSPVVNKSFDCVDGIVTKPVRIHNHLKNSEKDSSIILNSSILQMNQFPFVANSLVCGQKCAGSDSVAVESRQHCGSVVENRHHSNSVVENRHHNNSVVENRHHNNSVVENRHHGNSLVENRHFNNSVVESRRHVNSSNHDSRNQFNTFIGGLNAARTQKYQTDIHPGGEVKEDDLAKDLLSVCNFVNPSLQSLDDFRFGNIGDGSGTIVQGFEKKGKSVNVSNTRVQSKQNLDSQKIPSLGVTNYNVTKPNGETVSPRPKLLCVKRKKRSGKKRKQANSFRPPIEIPKLRVKVCIVPGESRYKCPDCDYITDTMPMVIIHMRESQHGGMKKKSYRCEKCSQKFSLKETLCQHRKTCTSHSKSDKRKLYSSCVPMKSVENNVLKNPTSSSSETASLNASANANASGVKVPKVEPVDTNAQIAQLKCAITFTNYPSLATFGDVSKYDTLKSSQRASKNENAIMSMIPKKKRKTHSNKDEELPKIKSKLDVVVKSEKMEHDVRQPPVKRSSDLPGIETFFSSKFSTPGLFGSQAPTSGSSYHGFVGSIQGVAPQKTADSFGDVQVNPLERASPENGKKDKSLSSIFPWSSIKSVLQSYPDDLTARRRCSESDVAVLSNNGEEYSLHDGSRANSQQTCLQCKANFKSLSLLRYHQHKNCHDGYEPYQCNQCEANFGSKGHLDTHLRKHTKEKPYYCPLCYRTFSRVDLVNSHLRIQHNMPIHISGKDVLLPKYMWSSEEENSMDVHNFHMDEN